MVPLPNQSVRAVRGSPQDRAAWTAWLGARDPGRLDGLSVLKSTPQVAVYAASVSGREVVLKCNRLSGLAGRAYAAIRASRGSRQWRGASRLRRLGIDVPACLALLRGRAGDERVEVLVMERVPGRTVLDHLAHGGIGVRAEHRVAEVLARQCAAMAKNGVFNRDHKPSNLVVRKATATEAHVAVLDTVAVRRLGGGACATGVPLERLVIEAIGVGARPRLALMARFVAAWAQETTTGHAGARGEVRREVWRVIAARVVAHGDPTPVDNPLSADVH